MGNINWAELADKLGGKLFEFLGRIVSIGLIAGLVVFMGPAQAGAIMTAVWNMYRTLVETSYELEADAVEAVLHWLNQQWFGFRRWVHCVLLLTVWPLSAGILACILPDAVGRGILIVSGILALGVVALFGALAMFFARWAQLTVELVQKPVFAGVKGLVEVLRSVGLQVAATGTPTQAAPAQFIDTGAEIRRLAMFIFMVAMAVASYFYWLILMPRWTVFFAVLLLAFGATALVATAKVGGFKVWGLRVYYKALTVSLVLALSAAVFATFFPRTWASLTTGAGVDTAMAACGADPASCARAAARKGVASGAVRSDAPRLALDVERKCTRQFRDLRRAWKAGAIDDPTYFARWQGVSRNCSASVVAVRSLGLTRPLSERILDALPLVGVGSVVLFFLVLGFAAARKRVQMSDEADEPSGPNYGFRWLLFAGLLLAAAAGAWAAMAHPGATLGCLGSKLYWPLTIGFVVLMAAVGVSLMVLKDHAWAPITLAILVAVAAVGYVGHQQYGACKPRSQGNALAAAPAASQPTKQNGSGRRADNLGVSPMPQRPPPAHGGSYSQLLFVEEHAEECPDTFAKVDAGRVLHDPRLACRAEMTRRRLASY